MHLTAVQVSETEPWTFGDLVFRLECDNNTQCILVFLSYCLMESKTLAVVVFMKQKI